MNNNNNKYPPMYQRSYQPQYQQTPRGIPFQHPPRMMPNNNQQIDLQAVLRRLDMLERSQLNTTVGIPGGSRPAPVQNYPTQKKVNAGPPSAKQYIDSFNSRPQRPVTKIPVGLHGGGGFTGRHKKKQSRALMRKQPSPYSYMQNAHLYGGSEFYNELSALVTTKEDQPPGQVLFKATFTTEIIDNMLLPNIQPSLVDYSSNAMVMGMALATIRDLDEAFIGVKTVLAEVDNAIEGYWAFMKYMEDAHTAGQYFGCERTVHALNMLAILMYEDAFVATYKDATSLPGMVYAILAHDGDRTKDSMWKTKVLTPAAPRKTAAEIGMYCYIHNEARGRTAGQIGGLIPIVSAGSNNTAISALEGMTKRRIQMNAFQLIVESLFHADYTRGFKFGLWCASKRIAEESADKQWFYNEIQRVDGEEDPKDWDERVWPVYRESPYGTAAIPRNPLYVARGELSYIADCEALWGDLKAYVIEREDEYDIEDNTVAFFTNLAAAKKYWGRIANGGKTQVLEAARAKIEAWRLKVVAGADDTAARGQVEGTLAAVNT